MIVERVFVLVVVFVVVVGPMMVDWWCSWIAYNCPGLCCCPWVLAASLISQYKRLRERQLFFQQDQQEAIAQYLQYNYPELVPKLMLLDSPERLVQGMGERRPREIH